MPRDKDRYGSSSTSARDDYREESGRDRDSRDARDRERDRDSYRDRDRERERDRERDRERERDRDRGGYSGRDRRDENGDRDRDRDRGRDRDRDRGRRRHGSASRSRERTSKSGDYHKESSSRDSKKKEHKRIRVAMHHDEDEEGEEAGRDVAAGNDGPVDIEKIKPNVEEKKGEISMSVEETNRVRAMLGLKPLNVGAAAKPTKEEIAEENMRLKREEDEKARELKNIQARIQRARTKRMLNEKLKGDTLAEVKEGEEDVLSTKGWVKRSRNKQVQMEEERLLAVERARILEEQELDMDDSAGDDKREQKGSGKKEAYGADNLAGLKVTHGADDFEAGDSVVLTLKDQGILEEDEHGQAKGLADHEDELENVNMKETERRRELDKEALRAKRGPYMAYDDEEFDGDVGPGAKRKVLSHYDEAKKEGPKLTLGEGGEARAASSTEGGERDGGEKKMVESLQVETKDASEYYTTEEMAKFKKPKKMRKKKIRKREEAGASSSLGLEAAIEETSRSGGASSSSSKPSRDAAANGAPSSNGTLAGGDHGSRAARAARLAAEGGGVAEVEAQRARFDSALARAEEKAGEKLADSFPKSKEKKAASRPAEDPMAFAEDLDGDLSVSLARARRLAQLKEKSKARKARDVGEAVLEAMQKVKVEPGEEKGHLESKEAGDSMDVDGGGVSIKKEQEGMIFTSTTEFTSRLEATIQERKRDSIAAAKKQKIKEEREAEARGAKQKHNRDSMDVDKTEGSEGEELESANHKRSRWKTQGGADEELDREEMEEMGENSDEESNDDTQLGFLHKQPLAKHGMAATLALLRPTGALQEKIHLSGRAKDVRKHFGEQEETRRERDAGVKLEYRDQWGRELTRKEAWRNLCYQFHGYGSGKKKQEKRLKQVEEEKKKEQTMDMNRLKTLQQTQEITKQAFVVVQGGSHIGAALPPPPPGLDLKKKDQPKKDSKVKSEPPSG